MSDIIESSFIRQSVMLFTTLPVLIFTLENDISGNFYQDILALLTIISYSLMLGQFLIIKAGYNKKDNYVGKLKVHKYVGYVCVAILFFHPVYLILPKLFETSLPPSEAFLKIITTLSFGVVSGMTAWILMFAIGAMSLFRKKMPLRYSTWRLMHGILSMLFICSASLHVIYIGRHSTMAMSVFVFAATVMMLLYQFAAYYDRKAGRC